MDEAVIIRFPIERRQTLDLLYSIVPDVREVMLLAEAYDLVIQHGVQDVADRDAAEHIEKQGLADGPARSELMRGMVDQAVRSAIAAISVANRLTEPAAVARADVEADLGRGVRDYDVEQEAQQLSALGAEATVKAYTSALIAFGVARAVDLATRQVSWSPRLVNDDAAWLLEGRSRVRPASGE